jgi:chemotaxis protein CheD
MDIVVGVADMKVSDDLSATLVTHSLGSCIGVAVYDSVAKVGGMLQFMFPDSKLDPGNAKNNPFMFADTAVPLFLESCYKLGVEKYRMAVKLAGGAQLIKASEAFSIGKRNHKVLGQILSDAQLPIEAEDVGGSLSKTMRLSIATGEVSLKVPGQDYETL